MLPVVGSQRDTVRRSAIDPVGFKISDRGALIRKWAQGRDGMPSGRLLDVRSDNPHLAKFSRDLGQSRNSGTIDPIVIGNQYAHYHLLSSPRRVNVVFLGSKGQA